MSSNEIINCIYLCLAGVILSSDPTPIESRQFAEEKKIAGILGTGSASSNTSTSTTTSTTTSTSLPDLLTTIPVLVTTEDTVIYG